MKVKTSQPKPNEDKLKQEFISHLYKVRRRHEVEHSMRRVEREACKSVACTVHVPLRPSFLHVLGTRTLTHGHRFGSKQNACIFTIAVWLPESESCSVGLGAIRQGNVNEKYAGRLREVELIHQVPGDSSIDREL